MNYKIKGIITAIGEIKTTKLGTAVQQLHFEQATGRLISETRGWTMLRCRIVHCVSFVVVQK